MTQTMTPTSLKVPTQPQYQITEADHERQKRIQRAWQAYDGELQKPLQKTPEGLDPNVMSNRCIGIVEAGRNFLFGKELGISASDTADKTAQTLLDATWGRKETRIPLLQELEMNGAMAGTAFLRIVPSVRKLGKPQKFRFVVIDPMTVFVETVPQDCKTVLCYCIEYSTEELQPDTGKPEQVTYREEICRIDPDGNARRDMPDDDDTWMITHWTRIGERGEWQSAGEPIAWPYPFSPIFACQNLPRPNSFWGMPDITEDIIGMNESLNMTNSCVNLVQIMFGQPLLYATDAGEGVIEHKPGQIIQMPLPTSKIEAVAIASDVEHALKFAGDIRSDIDEQSHVPGVATGRMTDMPRGRLSGIAIELMYQPLNSKTETKKCLYGKQLIDASQAVLVLAGIAQSVDEIDIELSWQSPLPHDDLESVQSAIALEEVGVSKTTRMRDLGYDPEEEARLRGSELERTLNSPRGGEETIPLLSSGIPGVPNLPGQQYPMPAAAGSSSSESDLGDDE